MPKTVKDAAIQVFEENQKPLHYKKLTKLILNKCNLSGQTPHETVRSLIGTDERFKRVAEGVYALSEWEEYPIARFAKDIAFDILEVHGKPLGLTRLGENIFKDRVFKGPSRQVTRNAIRNDDRFVYDVESDLVALTIWGTN